MTKWIEGGAITVKLVRGKCWFFGFIPGGALGGPTTSTRIALQFLLNIPVLGRGVNYCIVSPRIKDWDLSSQLCFLSLPPSITVVSEKDNLIKNNKNFNYDTTWELNIILEIYVNSDYNIIWEVNIHLEVNIILEINIHLKLIIIEEINIHMSWILFVTKYYIECFNRDKKG